MKPRGVIIWAGLLGFSGVALGALGTHGLRPLLEQHGYKEAWDTGVRYHLVHAVALLGLAGWLRTATGPAAARALWAARLWIAGVILFSGSLYGLATTGARWLGPVTPAGGLLLLCGWFALIAAGLSSSDSP